MTDWVLFAFNKRITSCINEWYSSSFSTHTEWLFRQFFHSIDAVFLCCMLPALWLRNTRRIRRTTLTKSKWWNILKPLVVCFRSNNLLEMLTKDWLSTINALSISPNVHDIKAPSVTIFDIVYRIYYWWGDVDEDFWKSWYISSMLFLLAGESSSRLISTFFWIYNVSPVIPLIR